MQKHGVDFLKRQHGHLGASAELPAPAQGNEKEKAKPLLGRKRKKKDTDVDAEPAAGNNKGSAAAAVTADTIESQLSDADENENDDNNNNNGDLPPKEHKPRKKRRKKKKKKLVPIDSSTCCEEFHNADGQHRSSPLNSSGRPGKRGLRKMKYERQHLSKAEFLMACAKRFSYTGSVALVNVNCTAVTGTTIITTTMSPPPSCEGVVADSQIRNNDESSGSFVQLGGSVQVQPLLVLDLNGILCHRIRRQEDPDYFRQNDKNEDTKSTMYRPSVGTVAGTPVLPRIDLTNFLQYLDEHFCLAVWTSAKTKTAKALIKLLFPNDVANRLLFIWCQNHCEMTAISAPRGDNDAADTLYKKDLNKVWKEYPLWNARNTLLMDDSPDKCEVCKSNAVHPLPLNGRSDQQQVSDGKKILLDSENEKLQRHFFEGLVQHFHPKTQCDANNGNNNENESSLPPINTMEENEELLLFLRKHGSGHMGWLGE